MTVVDWALLILLSIVWGRSFFFVEVALDGVPPFTLVMLRVGLAAGALHIYLVVSGNSLSVDPMVWFLFLVMGLLNNAVPFVLITWGQTEITSSLAAILNATAPLFTVLVAHVGTEDERLTWQRTTGVLAGLVGVAIMVGPDALSGLGTGVLAQLAVLGAAISYAFAAVFGRRFKRLGITATQTAAGQLTGSTMLLIPVALIWDRPWDLPLPSMTIGFAVLGLALFSTALAYIIYFRVLASAGATNLLLVTFLVPISAGILGIAILGEHLTGSQLIGMLLIGAGPTAIDGRPFSIFSAFRAR